MKYYRCTRDLIHYRHEGMFYNYEMGQIVPYTPIVQANLMNFEPFGNSYEREDAEPYKKEDEDLFDDKKIEDYLKRHPERVPVKIVEKIVEKIIEVEKIVEVEVKVPIEEIPVKPKRARRTKAQMEADRLKNGE